MIEGGSLVAHRAAVAALVNGMDIYSFSLAIGGVGFGVMALGGVGRHGHAHAGHGSGGHAHAGHAHAGHAQAAPGHAAHAHAPSAARAPQATHVPAGPR